MITYRSEISQIKPRPNGLIWVRRTDLTLDDGVIIDKAYHRHVVAPGDDLNREHGLVQAVARPLHTPEVIEAYRLSQQQGV